MAAGRGTRLSKDPSWGGSARPSPQRRIESTQAEPPASVAATPVALRDPGVVGREPLIDRLLDALSVQTLRYACLSGSSGIGKTVAARELVSRLEGAGWNVFRVSCYPDMPPLGLWQQVIAMAGGEDAVELAAGTEAVLRAQHQGLSAAQRSSALARDVARQQLFEKLAERASTVSGRTLLCVDDVQWADADSLGLLEHTLRLRPSWALVTTFNTEVEAAGAVRARELCLRLDRATVVEVGPLGLGDVSCYLERALGVAPYDGWVRALHTRSGGHPLFLRELVQALVDRGVVLHAWTESPELDGVLPPLLRELLERRGKRLSTAASRVLRIASVLEGDLDVALLSELGGCSRVELLSCFDELARAGILHASPAGTGRLQFVHGLVREAFYDALESGERARLHLGAAAAFDRRARKRGGFALVQAARHARLALPLSEPAEVAASCRAAARWQAGQGACLEAATLEEQAFAISEQYGLGTERDRLAHTLRLGRAYLACGFKDKTLSTYRRAIEGARSLRCHRAQVDAVLGHTAAQVWGRHPNQGEEHLLSEALLLVAHDSPLRARLLSRRATLRGHRVITPEEIAMAREAVRLAEKHSSGRDSRAWLDANHALHFVLQGVAHRTERQEVARRLLELQQKHGLSEHTYSIREILAGLRLTEGDRAGHDALLAEGQTAAARHPHFAWLHQVACTTPALMAGLWEEAEQRIRKAAAVGALTHNPQVTPVAMGQRLILYRAQGRVAELRPELEQRISGMAWLGDYPQASLAVIYAELGELDRARAVFEPLVTGWLTRPASHAEWLSTAAELAWLSVKLGDRARCAQLAELLTPYSQLHVVHLGMNYYAGPVARYLGLLASLGGDPAESVVWLGQARDACVAVGASAFCDIIDRDVEALPTRPASRAPGHRAGANATATKAAPSPVHLVTDALPKSASAAVLRTGEGWLLRYQGQESFVGSLLGFRYLAELLAHPHRSMRARALVDLGVRSHGPGGPPASPGVDGLSQRSADHGEPTIDKRALAAYRDRLKTLDAELEEALAHRDRGTADRLEHEKEALRQELSRALNLFGRPRKVGGRDERARVSCTRAIRKALGILSRCHPALGAHLGASIRTGHECVYAPSTPVEWDCRP